MGRTYDPVALEILKIARELVINEYTDKRAQDHNKWLASSELFWKNNKAKLPYPDIPPYPTEVEIVNRAQVLMNFLNYNYIAEADNQEKTVNDSVTESEPAVEVSDIEVVDIPVELTAADAVEKLSAFNVIVDEPVSKSIFPSFFGKNKK